MVDQAKHNQVATKNAALFSLNNQSGKQYLTTAQNNVETTAKEKSEAPGEKPKSILPGFMDPSKLTWFQAVAVTAAALVLFYLALKNKWIRV